MEMALAREAASDLRKSLRYTYNQTLEKIGGSGLAFIRPQPQPTASVPAAAAIPEAEPPDHLLQHDIFTTSSGRRYDTLGEVDGWPGIEQRFHLGTESLAHTGFEPEMQPHSGVKPLDWQSGHFHWWDPNSITPEDHYWKEVEVTHPALSLGQLLPDSVFKRFPDFHQILRRWFEDKAAVYHYVCTGLSGILRHRGGRSHRGAPGVPTSTFGWCELFHTTEALKISNNAPLP